MIPVQRIRGFNYAPSYAYTGADIWRYFDREVFDRELGWGKQHYPGMNGVRIWLAWEVYGLGSEGERQRFLDCVDSALDVADNHGLVVMPVLFNRWHHGLPDWGGVYLDHLLPDAGWAGVAFTERWTAYVRAIMSRFGHDSRIFAWDLCNEPYSYSFDASPNPAWQLDLHETAWLHSVYEECRSAGAEQPLSAAFWKGPDHLAKHLDLSDILNFHLYWQGDPAGKAQWLTGLDQCVEIREKTGRPLFCSESCWGSLDDRNRAQIVEFTLDELNKREIGWLIHALSHSRIADLHRPDDGPVQLLGAMHCVEADGSIRPYHQVINDYL